MVNGKPAIAYVDRTDPANMKIKYAWSSVADGSSGWTALIVDNVNKVNQWCCLDVIAGKPALSYWGAVSQDLRYAYSSQDDGSSGWSTVSVHDDADPNIWIGQGNWLATVNGKPGISYIAYNDNTGNSELRFAYSSQDNGSSGWNSLSVSGLNSSDSNWQGTGLLVRDGFPSIASYDGQDELWLSTSNQANGQGGWSTATVQAGGASSDFGLTCNIQQVNGYLAIAHRDGQLSSLRYSILID